MADTKYVSYTYDSVGNRTQRNSTLPAVLATGLLNYDANGSPLQSGAGANVYDFEKRGPSRRGEAGL